MMTDPKSSVVASAAWAMRAARVQSMMVLPMVFLFLVVVVFLVFGVGGVADPCGEGGFPPLSCVSYCTTVMGVCKFAPQLVRRWCSGGPAHVLDGVVDGDLVAQRPPGQALGLVLIQGGQVGLHSVGVGAGACFHGQAQGVLGAGADRKSTRLNSSHVAISY